MSVRYLQRFKRIRLKDGTLSTALTVILAFDRQPPSKPQDEWSPSMSHQTDHTGLLPRPADQASALAPVDVIEPEWVTQAVRLDGQQLPLPLLLDPKHHVNSVNTTSIEKVLNLKAEGKPVEIVKQLIMTEFPDGDFNQQLRAMSLKLLLNKCRAPEQRHRSRRRHSGLSEKPLLEFASTTSARSDSPQASALMYDGLCSVALHYIPPVQQWLGFRFYCLLQLAQASIVEARDTPAMARDLGQLYKPTEISGHAAKFRDTALKRYARLQDDFKGQVKALMRAFSTSERREARWKAYYRGHNLKEIPPVLYGDVHQYFHAAQFMFKNSPPDFFITHRCEFAELAELLTAWAVEWSEETKNEAAAKILSRSEYLSDAIFNLYLSSEDLAVSKKVDAFFISRQANKTPEKEKR
eukprot:Blabericola_migrator_1__6237@NODE_3148_length_2008_cov_39_798557_g1970_i0_p1_GENE_NODE_3148_length_2008_cov_39_798557_g1970_i0NODE_3148_length_2008_cov_39_798557_g1970_i0_p1_ORF_typecomplete_len410_score48_51Cas_Cas5d/PF09704_10/0_21_NODE_3148_length_2008_cov_39_798557_g1970_i01091338